jgi:hypothetical protein
MLAARVEPGTLTALSRSLADLHFLFDTAQLAGAPERPQAGILGIGLRVSVAMRGLWVLCSDLLAAFAEGHGPDRFVETCGETLRSHLDCG